MNTVSIKNQLKVAIPVYVDKVKYSCEDFIEKYHNYNVLRNLPPVYAAGNMVLTPGGAKYYNSMRLMLTRNRRGWLIPNRITSPDKVWSGMTFTHPQDLRHGKVSTTNMLGSYQFDNVFKAGKRLKLITGFAIAGTHPPPTSIGIASGDHAEGILYISQEYASGFQLHLSTNQYHQVDVGHLGEVLEDLDLVVPSDLSNRSGVTILKTGDKIAGVLPSGHMVKGTAIVVQDLGYDLVMTKDSIKCSGVPYNNDTRFWIRLLASQRLSTYNTRLSYQIGQFIPEVVGYRINTLLHTPIVGVRGEEVDQPVSNHIRTSTYSGMKPLEDGSESLQPLGRSRINLLTQLDGLSVYQLCLNLSSRVWDDVTKLTCINLFKWVEHDESGSEVVKSIHWAEDIANGMDPYKNKRLMTTIKREIVIRLSKMISPPVKGAWGVATPQVHISNDSRARVCEYSISLPYRIYRHLGSPSIVACIRYPVKGISSLVRLVCTHHPDTDSTFHVDTNVMKYIWNGDYDGDLIQVVSDPDIVDAACDIPTSMSRCNSITTPDIQVEYPPLSGNYDTDLVVSQALVASWRGDVGIVCNIRDSLYGAGLMDELQCIKYFELIFQPALSQMDGSLPVARYLLDNPSILAGHIGIDISHLLGEDGTIRKGPSTALSAIRGNLQYDKFIEVVMNTTPDHPHGILLHPFKILPVIK